LNREHAFHEALYNPSGEHRDLLFSSTSLAGSSNSTSATNHLFDGANFIFIEQAMSSITTLESGRYENQGLQVERCGSQMAC
jgi:hypothetical protein